MVSILGDVKVGIQSWCFRGFKGNDEVIRAIKECGLDTVELSGIHLDWYKNRDTVRNVVAL